MSDLVKVLRIHCLGPKPVVLSAETKTTMRYNEKIEISANAESQPSKDEANFQNLDPESV